MLLPKVPKIFLLRVLVGTQSPKGDHPHVMLATAAMDVLAVMPSAEKLTSMLVQARHWG